MITAVLQEVCSLKYTYMNIGNKYSLYILIRQKVKSVLLQAWSGPEGSKKLRFPDYMTTAQDVGKVVSLTHRPPLPQEIHMVLISIRG